MSVLAEDAGPSEGPASSSRSFFARHPALAVLVVGSLAAVGIGHGLASGDGQTVPLQMPAGGDTAVARLEQYAATLSARHTEASPPAAASQSTANLPDVATMTARLEARLANSPDDADGWRLLGFAHQHLGNVDASINAFEHALQLRPGDAELTATLAGMRAVDGAAATAKAQ